MKRPESSPYRGRALAVGTRHGKEQQFSTAFEEVLGARLVVPPDLNTDQYGTFSGEVVRIGSAVDAARAKARLGMRAAGVSRGLASEASYGTLPGLGWSGHEEILVFVDDVNGMEVIEGHRMATPLLRSHRVGSISELPVSVLEILPEQALIVRPAADCDGGEIVKGIEEEDVLQAAIAAAASASVNGLALVEPDLRAHHNPQRRQVLSRMAYRLAHRLATPCQRCGCPGYGRVDVVAGLPCRRCGSPTALPISELHACARCDHHGAKRVAEQDADPSACPDCNP